MTTFATILKRALHERDITASDLARRIWGEGDEPFDGLRGARNGAKNRQIISQYLNGKTQPRLATIERIAAALQIPVEELTAPNLNKLEAKFDGDTVRLRIDRDVDRATAMKIIGMLSA